MNRKLVFITGLCALFAAAGCRQEEKELRIEKTEVRLHAGETLRIGSNIAAQWSSANEFTATVDSDGNVTGQHVGSVTVTAVAGSSRQECRVEVEPRYDTYIEPAYELFGKPASLLETTETRELIGRDSKKITYKGEKPYIDRIKYWIYDTEEGTYIHRADIFIADDHREEVENFLGERYRLFLGSDGIPQFYNNVEKKASIVAFPYGNIDQPGYFVVCYRSVSQTTY